MKIRKLFLTAFGPFTDAALDFSGAANLHLVYGANEAGKSSALRAMTDLRYGIPARSKDDFVHGFKDMLLAGCFEDAAGHAVGLARRKGNKDPLMGADPASGLPLTGPPVSAEVLLALTGGIGREQFDTMYGLNSLHLRKGGQMLIQGEGELGAALFEASTGAAGIRQMLQTLQADARKYFIPKGQVPVLNESARQLEEARQRYRQALTRPDQWKALKRHHDEAQARLSEVRQQLASQRRRLEELTELRAVEPLLRELDMAQSQWTAVEAHVVLPAGARDCRLAALQHRSRSQAALAEADEAIEACRHSLLALYTQPSLLAHGAAIDRLVEDVSLVRRERDVRLRLQAVSDDEARQLVLRARQMQTGGQAVCGPEEFFGQAPSSADQAEVLRALESLQALNVEGQHVRVRLAADRDKLAQLQRSEVSEPAPALRQALTQALERARALGDAPQRLAVLQTAADIEQRKLDILLGEMGLQSAGQLTTSRWLAVADINAWDGERGELLRQSALNDSQALQLKTDLALQVRRGQQLAATGEVVTADTLRRAREVRNASWQALRVAFLTPGGGPPADALPAQFEQAQAQADRQADLLREGAQRAAEVAECTQRIADMTEALADLQRRQASDAGALASLDGRWRDSLLQLGIPAGTAAGVREWLVARQSALDRHERLGQTRLAQAQLAQQIEASCHGLSEALQALGHASPPPAALLDERVGLAAQAERELASTQAAGQRWRADLASLAKTIEADQIREAELNRQSGICRDLLDRYCGRLQLVPGTEAATVKARLAELQRWINDYQVSAGHQQQLRQMRASEEAAARSAVDLGGLLGEAVWQHADAWLDDLAGRLSRSREAAAAALALKRREAEETARRLRALADLEEARRALDSLVRQAGVQDADALPHAETRSDEQLALRLRLQGLQDQLARTSIKDSATLRQELASLDSMSIELEKQTCSAGIEQLEAEEKTAIDAEQEARGALTQIDTSGEAAQAREEMESAIARYRAGVRPWAQLKLAEALLGEALRRHRDKAQGPVVALASEYFQLMTAGRFVRLVVDADSQAPVLLAQPTRGQAMEIAALSEGTADQLYLALRLAALQIQRKPGRMMPLVLDDVFMTADDDRAAHMFRALAKFAAGSQVLVFTHHHHLLALACGAVEKGELQVHRLEAGPGSGPGP